jgi:hypothetical protein
MNKDIVLLKEKLNTNLIKLQKNMMKIIFEDFNVLFDKTLKNNKQKRLLLKEFQDRISSFINNKKFIEQYETKYKMLISNIFQIYINMYNMINKKYNYISIPTSENYILETYTIFARQLWKYPHLYNNLKKDDNIKTLREIEKLIKSSIEESFSNLLSFDNYEESINSDDESEKSYEEDEDEENISETIISKIGGEEETYPDYQELYETTALQTEITEDLDNEEEEIFEIDMPLENNEVPEQEPEIHEDTIDIKIPEQEPEVPEDIIEELEIHEDTIDIKIPEQEPEVPEVHEEDENIILPLETNIKTLDINENRKFKKKKHHRVKKDDEVSIIEKNHNKIPRVKKIEDIMRDKMKTFRKSNYYT